MKKKIADFVKSNKAAVCTSVSSMAVAVMSTPAFASETTSSLSEQMRTALSDGLNTMVGDFIGYVALVLPIGLTAFGAVFGVKKGIAFFSSIAKK